MAHLVRRLALEACLLAFTFTWLIRNWEDSVPVPEREVGVSLGSQGDRGDHKHPQQSPGQICETGSFEV
jgi:hypothetical protein